MRVSLIGKDDRALLSTFIYILGALSLHFTDIHGEDAFASLFLPMVNVLFFIFLVWQLLFYFSLGTFSHGDNPGFLDLLYQCWHLDVEIARVGWTRALFTYALMLLNAASLFIAVFYYLDMFLAVVRL